MAFKMKIFSAEARPGDGGQQMEDINPFFSSSYVFASKYIKDKIVLDSGCGTGYGAKFLAKQGASLVTAVDIDKKVIRQCQKRYSRVKNLKFEACEADIFQFNRESFDVVISMEVIEHVRNYRKYLREIRRVLKRKGILIIATPNKKIFSPGLKKPMMAHHVKEFYSRELSLILKRNFSKVNMYGKFITNKQYLEEKKLFQESWKYAVIKFLAKFDFVRLISKYIPYSFRQLISSGEKTILTRKDIIISKNNIDEADSLMAVCYK